MCKDECGQSLVETLLLIPIFLLVLSGIVILFQNAKKNYHNEHTRFSLQLSEAHFSQKERQMSLWRTKNKDGDSLLNQQSRYALQGSWFFKQSVDMEKGVFFEEIPIHPDNSCGLNASFATKTQWDGKFEITTCADENAYQRAVLHSFGLGKMLNNLQGNAIFTPSQSFSWTNRQRQVMTSYFWFAQLIDFKKFNSQISSVWSNNENSWSASCFMNPFSHSCQEHQVEHKLSRAAKDGSNVQVTACYAEGVLKCAAQTGPAFPVCLATQLSLLKADLILGKSSQICPILNQVIKTQQHVVHGVVHANSLLIQAEELAIRADFLSVYKANKEN